MTHADTLKQWLARPAVTGWEAMALAILAVAIPAALRESLRGIVSGCETTAFIPFVLFSAIFLGWRHATLVALAAAWSADFLFMGHNHRLLDGACDIFGDGAFLLSSALIIGLVEGIRGQISELPASGTERKSGGIVFSLRDGEAWASWYGGGSPVRLGREEDVAEMMEDFLAQLEIGKRLNGEEPV